MKQAKPAPSENGESSAVVPILRRDYVNVRYDGPRNPWPQWAWKPEKEEEIVSFMRQCAALRRIDPDGDRRWHAESEHFAPWRHAFERQERWWSADRRLEDKMYARRPAAGKWCAPRWDKWLRVGKKLDEAMIGQYWLCRIKAELARAELRATDLDAGDLEAARDWLVQCQWFEKFLAECWSAECKRSELDQRDGRRQPDSSDLHRWRDLRWLERFAELHGPYPLIKQE